MKQVNGIEIMNFTDWSCKKGVYGIHNIINNKVYIGSSNALSRRLAFHRGHLRKGSHPHAIHLQKAWNKYGESNFKFLIIEELSLNITKEEIIDREQCWIDFYNPADPEFGYNTCPKANSCLGVKHSDEMRKKVSEATKGEKNGFYGKHHTTESKEKISKLKKGIKPNWLSGNSPGKGKKPSEETKKKISETHRGNKNHFFGKKHTEETKTKISNANLGRKISTEGKDKMRKSKKCKFKAPWQVVIGESFGRYITISEPFKDCGKWKIYAKCKCGKEKSVTIYDILNGKILSCGCFRKEKTVYQKRKPAIFKEELNI